MLVKKVSDIKELCAAYGETAMHAEARLKELLGGKLEEVTPAYILVAGRAFHYPFLNITLFEHAFDVPMDERWGAVAPCLCC